MAALGARPQPALAAFAVLCLTSCTVVLHREHDQCQTSADCQSLAAGAVCTESGICERLQVPQSASARVQACQLDSDCTDAWSVCRHGTCRVLDANGCVPLGAASTANTRDRLPIGVLVPAAELAGAGGGPNFGAALVAINELNQALTSAFPEIVAVACDEDDPAARETLLNAEVRILVGPMQAQSIEQARSSVNGQAVFFGPYADAPELDPPPLGPTSSLVSCKPNRSAVKAALNAAIGFVQDQLRRRSLIATDSTTVLALSDAEHSLGFDALAAELESASVVSVKYPSNPAGQGLVAALQRQAIVPSLLVSASAVDDWSQNVAAVDDSPTAGGGYPYYLLSEKQSNVLALATEVNGSKHPQYERVFSLDDSLSASEENVHALFSQTFQQTTSKGLSEGLDFVRDCVYLATYAAISAQLRFSLSTSELSAEALLVGLRALTGGRRELTTAVADIPKVLVELQTHVGFDGSASLSGGSGNLGLVGLGTVEQIAGDPARQYVRPNERDQALYCIDPKLGFTSVTVISSATGAVVNPDATTAFASCLQGASP